MDNNTKLTWKAEEKGRSNTSSRRFFPRLIIERKGTQKGKTNQRDKKGERKCRAKVFVGEMFMIFHMQCGAWCEGVGRGSLAIAILPLWKFSQRHKQNLNAHSELGCEINRSEWQTFPLNSPRDSFSYFSLKNFGAFCFPLLRLIWD